MSFLDFFRKKQNAKEDAAANAGAVFIPSTAASDASSLDTATPSHGSQGAETATTTDSGSFFGGDAGGASGGDGGGGGI